MAWGTESQKKQTAIDWTVGSLRSLLETYDRVIRPKMKYGFQAAEEPSGIRLMRLLDTFLPRINREEWKNDTRICLYGTGEYWTAFEQSAYRLCRLFPSVATSIVMRAEFPFPVVMVCVPDSMLRAYGQRHIFHRDEPDYKELSGEKLSVERYREWHNKAIRKFTSLSGSPVKGYANESAEA